MARNFDGSTDRVDYGLPFETTGKPISIIAKVLFDSLSPGANSRFVFNSGASGGSTGTFFGLRATTVGSLQFGRVCNTTNRSAGTAANALTSTTNYYVIGVSDAGSLSAGTTSLYIDGSSIAVSADTAGSTTETTANAGWSVGGRASADDRNIDGKIAWIVVYDRSISASAHMLIARGAIEPNSLQGVRFFVDYRMGDYKDNISLTGLLDGTRPYSITPNNKVYSRGARIIPLFSTSPPAITSTSDSNKLIDESALTINGTNLTSATAVTIKQTGRPNFDATSYINTNSATQIVLNAMDVQDMSMAYGAATIEVTTAGGTNTPFNITIDKKSSQQYITLSGHTSGDGWALGEASANSDQLVAPLTTTGGGTFAFVGTDGSYTITYPGSAPSSDTAYWAWFDDSADQWYESTINLNFGVGEGLSLDLTLDL